MPDYLSPYTFVTRNGREGFVLTGEAQAVTEALFDNAYRWDDSAGGRGGIGRFPLGEGEGVVRRFRRGGLISRLLRDRYVSNRMRQELEVTARLFRVGAAIPQPLGAVWERRGMFYRGAIASRAIPASSLLEALRQGRVSREILVRSGQCIREMHDANVWHADLQAANILVDGARVWLIDFDNSRSGRPLSRIARARNLLRLRRSLEKHGQSLDNFTSILEGYGELGIPCWLSGMYHVRGLVSDALRK